MTNNKSFIEYFFFISFQTVNYVGLTVSVSERHKQTKNEIFGRSFWKIEFIQESNSKSNIFFF